MFNGLSASATLTGEGENGKDSKLYNYLNKNCKWLLLPLTGHTNLVTDSFKNLIPLNENITIKASKYAGVPPPPPPLRGGEGRMLFFYVE